MKHFYVFIPFLLLTTIRTSVSAQCWKMISPGAAHTVAIKSDNTLWAWGLNASGQLGDNTQVEKQIPIRITSTSDWKTVSAGGGHTLAIKTDGSLWAWGDNQWGQIGDGTFGNIRLVPVAIGTAKDWVAISAGEGFSVALKGDGTLWTWGDNFYGQLGHGTTAYAPKKVGIATDWKHISAGGNHVVALKTNNTLWAWGQNLSGQLGDGAQTNRSAPVSIEGTSNWLTVEAGYEHTLALKSDGTLWTWGDNANGELGNNTIVDANTPVQIGNSTWKAIAAGKDNSLGVKDDGTLWSWGFIIGGVVMGEDTYRTAPAQLTPTTAIESIALGDDHAFAFASNGAVLTWGIGSWGKLGDDSWIDKNIPTILFTPAPVGPGVQLICEGSTTIASLVATGTNVLWYNAPTGGTQLSATTPVVDGIHYYASQTKYGCVSQTRLDVLVNIRTAPGPPVGPPNYTFCSGERLSNVPVVGDNVKWYDSGNSSLTAALVTLTDKVLYYASQTVDGCESLQRYNVLASQNTTAAPNATFLTQTFCTSAMIGNLVTTSGTNVKWYADATSTAVLPLTTPVVSGSSYFGTSTVNGLESCTRLKVTSMITNASAPSGAIRQPFCNGGRVALLKATGATGAPILWYNVSTGGTALIGTQSLVNGMYYASQKIGACESVDRLPVEVVVNTTATPAPTGNANQILCDQAPVTDLVVTGENIKWYLDATTNTTWTGEALETSYYATQTIDACESAARLKVNVTTNKAALPLFATATPFRAKLVKGSVDFSIAIKDDDGTLWSWGANASGALGNGSNTGTLTPVMISADSDWVSVATGDAHALALKANGTLWAWGTNSAGQLGDGSTTNRLIPIQIGTDTDWKMIAAGSAHTLALKTNGTLWSCGWNYAGQTGIITDRAFPLIGFHQVGTASDWDTIDAGGWQSIALKNDGTLWVWGKIGNGTNDGSTVQVKIPSDNLWRAIASGEQHVFGIQTDGSLWAFGSNEYGQLGDGSSLASQSAPVRVGTDSDWKEVSGGRAHSVAVKSDGTLWAWGQNAYAQVGVPLPPWQFNVPTRVGNDADWRSVSGGYEHNVGIRKNGTVWSWGRNRSGQLGDGTRLTVFAPRPVQMNDLYTCGSGVLSDVKSNASQLNWYASPGMTTLLDPTTPIVSGNQYFVSETANGKESCYRKGVTIVATQTPPAPPSGNSIQYLCAGSTISDLDVVGKNITWYDAPTGGTVLTTSMALVNGAHYYASQRPEGCESATRLDVAVNLNVIAAPTVTALQTFCEGATVTQLAATGTSIRWYPTTSDLTPLASNVILTNNTQYFASQKVGSCESSRNATTVTVRPLPPAPTGNVAPIFCQASSVADLQATGANLVWYDLQSGGAPLIASTTLVNNKHYFATQSVNGCVSPQRFELIATIKILGTAPTNQYQYFCQGATIANLSSAGTGVKWYISASGGSALASTTLLTTRQYFVAQTYGPCESPRLVVNVTVSPMPTAPTGNASQIFCGSGTIANLSATGSNIKWYDLPIGGSALTPSTALVNGKHYYASQQPTTAYCESDQRLDVTAIVITASLPAANAVQEFCNSATIADLVASGSDLKWYAASAGGPVLSPGTALANYHQYFVSQTISTCESGRLAVIAKVNPIPLAPTGPGAQTFCNSATVADLSASGENILWHNAGGAILLPSNALVNHQEYYASQTISGCSSVDQFVVDVTLINTTKPQAESPQVFCAGATIADFDVSGSNLVWYETSDQTSALATNTILEDGHLYFVAERIGICESPRQQITTVVKAIPPAPTGSSSQTFCDVGTITDLDVEGENILWYDAGGGTLSASTALTNNGKYYASQTTNGCSSVNRLEVDVKLVTTTTPQAETIQYFCEGATIADFNVEGSNLVWFATSDAIYPLATNAIVEDGRQYFVAEQVDICVSPRQQITAMVSAVPPAPIGSGLQTFCNSHVIADLVADGENIRWYDAGGTVLSPSTVLVNDGKYFASQTSNGCTSVDLFEVNVTLIAPTTPQGEAFQNFCGAATIADFNVVGSNIVWYATINDVNELPISTSLEDGKAYFVAESNKTCESPRRQITALVKAIPPAPTGESFQQMEKNTIADLVVDGENVTWYPSEADAISRTNPLSMAQVLINNTSYYATQKISGCESDDVFEVTVSIITAVEQAMYDLKYQPNPVKDYLNISMGKLIHCVALRDALGRTVLTKVFNNKQGTIDFSGLPNGVFILSIHADDLVLPVKIVKQ